MSAKPDACEMALRKLAARDRTEKEIRDYLKSLEFDCDEIENATAFLKEYGYLDDDRYCKKYYVYARSKHKALYRIIRELGVKGIDSSRARAAIEDMDDEPEYEEEIIDDKTLALRVGIKMARDLKESGKTVDEKFCARVGRRLLSLGYGSNICYFVIDKIRNGGLEDE